MKLIKKFLKKREEKEVYLKMFPRDLSSDVLEVVKIIPIYESPYGWGIRLLTNEDKALEFIEIFLNNEIIKIPPRTYVYNNEPSEELIKKLTEKQKLILSCIYSMSSNGYVREKYLKNIVTKKDDWIIPFVLKSLGDYVIEITKVTESELFNTEDKTPYKNFIKNNKKYWDYLKARTISYWSVFYRGKEYRKYTDYPAVKVANFLEK